MGVEVHSAEFRRIIDSLRRVAALLRENGVRYAVIGSVANWARGGPETVNDLDLVVAPEDLEQTVGVLEEAGMRIEHPPEGWLVKAWDGDVLVDVIHQVTGMDDVHPIIDDAEVMRVASLDVPVARLEDALTPKLLAFDEHYLDYEGALRVARALREQVDWDLLRERVGHSPYARGFIGLCEELGVVPRAPRPEAGD